MKYVTSINGHNSQDGVSSTLSFQGKNLGWVMKVNELLRNYVRPREEVPAPPPGLSKTVSPRTWRRHSALLCCWEEQYRHRIHDE